MKLQIATIAILSVLCNVQAFTGPSSSATQGTRTSSSSLLLSMSTSNNEDNSNDHNNLEKNTSRRAAISTMASSLLLPLLTLSQQPQAAFAARREPLPEYLTEPTEEFKNSERQRDEFRRAQLIVKRKFNTVLDRLTFESKTEEELVADLRELKQLVIETEGLPLGIKKDEMVKIIRAKKAKGFWPTNVEIAYQKLTFEIQYQQSPNKDKDLANPL